MDVLHSLTLANAIHQASGKSSETPAHDIRLTLQLQNWTVMKMLDKFNLPQECTNRNQSNVGQTFAQALGQQKSARTIEEETARW